MPSEVNMECFFCKKEIFGIDLENHLAFPIVGPTGETVYACAHHPGVPGQVRVTQHVVVAEK